MRPISGASINTGGAQLPALPTAEGCNTMSAATIGTGLAVVAAAGWVVRTLWRGRQNRLAYEGSPSGLLAKELGSDAKLLNTEQIASIADEMERVDYRSDWMRAELRPALVAARRIANQIETTQMINKLVHTVSPYRVHLAFREFPAAMALLRDVSDDDKQAWNTMHDLVNACGRDTCEGFRVLPKMLRVDSDGSAEIGLLGSATKLCSHHSTIAYDALPAMMDSLPNARIPELLQALRDHNALRAINVIQGALNGIEETMSSDRRLDMLRSLAIECRENTPQAYLYIGGIVQVAQGYLSDGAVVALCGNIASSCGIKSGDTFKQISQSIELLKEREIPAAEARRILTEIVVEGKNLAPVVLQALPDIMEHRSADETVVLVNRVHGLGLMEAPASAAIRILPSLAGRLNDDRIINMLDGIAKGTKPFQEIALRVAPELLDLVSDRRVPGLLALAMAAPRFGRTIVLENIPSYVRATSGVYSAEETVKDVVGAINQMQGACENARWLALFSLKNLIELAPTATQTPWWYIIYNQGGEVFADQIISMVAMLEMLDAPDRAKLVSSVTVNVKVDQLKSYLAGTLSLLLAKRSE